MFPLPLSPFSSLPSFTQWRKGYGSYMSIIIKWCLISNMFYHSSINNVIMIIFIHNIVIKTIIREIGMHFVSFNQILLVYSTIPLVSIMVTSNLLFVIVTESGPVRVSITVSSPSNATSSCDANTERQVSRVVGVIVSSVLDKV